MWDFWEVRQLRETPPRSGYECRETPDLWSTPFISESFQLSSVSSDTLTLLFCHVHKLHSRSFQILRICSTDSRLRKFLDCVEQVIVKSSKNFFVTTPKVLVSS